MFVNSVNLVLSYCFSIVKLAAIAMVEIINSNFLFV